MFRWPDNVRYCAGTSCRVHCGRNLSFKGEQDGGVQKQVMHPSDCGAACHFHHREPSVPPLQYVVKRKGLDFSACGLVDAKACKRQRLAGPSKDEAAPCPVSIQLLDEWDAFTRGFRCAVHAHSDAGELDLGEDMPSVVRHYSSTPW